MPGVMYHLQKTAGHGRIILVADRLNLCPARRIGLPDEE
jgi:hypothetical protein